MGINCLFPVKSRCDNPSEGSESSLWRWTPWGTSKWGREFLGISLAQMGFGALHSLGYWSLGCGSKELLPYSSMFMGQDSGTAEAADWRELGGGGGSRNKHSLHLHGRNPLNQLPAAPLPRGPGGVIWREAGSAVRRQLEGAATDAGLCEDRGPPPQ